MKRETQNTERHSGNNQLTLTLAGELGQWIMTERRKKCQRESGLSEERFDAGRLIRVALNRFRTRLKAGTRRIPQLAIVLPQHLALSTPPSTTSPSCRLPEQEDSPAFARAGSPPPSMRVLCPQAPVEATLPAHPALLMPRLFLTPRAP